MWKLIAYSAVDSLYLYAKSQCGIWLRDMLVLHDIMTALTFQILMLHTLFCIIICLPKFTNHSPSTFILKYQIFTPSFQHKQWEFKGSFYKYIMFYSYVLVFFFFTKDKGKNAICKPGYQVDQNTEYGSSVSLKNLFM